MPTLGATEVTFNKVAREWRCKYALDGEGKPHGSESLKACEALLKEHLPKLKALPNAEVTRVVCGGCGDFKVIINQPCADHDKWAADEFPGEKEFMDALKAIPGTSRHDTQEFTMEML